MKKAIIFFSIILSFISVGSVLAQTSGLLQGSIIRYHTNKTSSKTVFDNNPATFMEALLPTGSWVGLDLGTSHVITQIEFISGTKNMQTGIFEASNDSSFADAVPLYLIKERTLDKVTYKVPVSVSKGFRYVRYFGANNSYCIINELKLYGYAGVGDNSKFCQITNLPTIVINTNGKEDITSKEIYVDGKVSVISNNGGSLYADSMRIKGRGNSSWMGEKKGFRIKLNNKTKMLGAPASAKDWTLIPIHGDKTLIRSMLAFDISKKMGMPYTPYSQMIDLVVNDEYRGTYMLCDQIEVDKNRVNIDKMSVTDTLLPIMEGGYLIEIDAYANTELSYFISQPKGIPVTIKYPKDDEIVPAQKAYIEGCFNTLVNSLFAENYKDTTNGYRKYLDVKSFVNYFLLEEFTGNTDAFWSTYMTKKRGDSLFYTGPVWDFDLSFENDFRTYPINGSNDFLCITKGSSAGSPNAVAGASNNSPNNNMGELIRRLLSDSTMVSDMKDSWISAREQKGLTREYLQSKIESLTKEIEESRTLNFVRWSNNASPLGSYQLEVLNVLNYSLDRLTWMDKRLGHQSPDSAIVKEIIAYEPVVIASGFNSDIVAESRPIDNYITRAMSKDYCVSYTSKVRVLGAMPDNGVLKSIKSNSVYKMAPYNTKQTLFAKQNEVNELVFDKPISTRGFSILASSTDGNALINTVINYTDGTSDTTLLNVDNWYFSIQKEAIANLGQIQAYTLLNKVMHNNFKLFEYPIVSNRAKLAKSITFKNVTDSRGFIFAVSKMTEPQTLRSVSGATGVDRIEVAESQFLKVWPNPVAENGMIHVQADNISKIRLVSTQGAVIKEVSTVSGSNYMDLQVSNVTRGSYVLQVVFVDGSIRSQVVMIK